MAKKHAKGKRVAEKAVPVVRELKTQLSEVDVFFLKANLDKSPDWLAAKMETDVETVNRYIEIIKANPDAAKPAEVKPGIYVATEASTMHADESRKVSSGSFIDRNRESCFKMREDEPAK